MDTDCFGANRHLRNAHDSRSGRRPCRVDTALGRVKGTRTAAASAAPGGPACTRAAHGACADSPGRPRRAPRFRVGSEMHQVRPPGKPQLKAATGHAQTARLQRTAPRAALTLRLSCSRTRPPPAAAPRDSCTRRDHARPGSCAVSLLHRSPRRPLGRSAAGFSPSRWRGPGFLIGVHASSWPRLPVHGGRRRPARSPGRCAHPVRVR